MATTPTYRPFQGLVEGGSVLNTPFSLGTSMNSRAFHLPQKTDHPLSGNVNPLLSSFVLGRKSKCFLFQSVCTP